MSVRVNCNLLFYFTLHNGHGNLPDRLRHPKYVFLDLYVNMNTNDLINVYYIIINSKRDYINYQRPDVQWNFHVYICLNNYFI